MGLIDEADGVAADAGALGVGQSLMRRRPRSTISPPVGASRQAGHMQQRGLSRARRAHQRHDLARHQRQVEPAEHFQLALAFLVSAGDVLQSQRAAVSLITQRLHRIEPRGTPGRIKRGQEGQRQRHHHHGGHLRRCPFRRACG